MLSEGLLGSEVGDPRQGKGPVGCSQCFLAIDVARFLPRDEFARRMDRRIGLMKSAAPAEDYDEVPVAGEPEWRAEQARRRDGIPVDPGVCSKLVAEASRWGAPAPCG